MDGCPQLLSGHREIDRAFRIALGDFRGNLQPWRGLTGGEPRICILAGLDYDQPWTRDAAFNSWYAGSLLVPDLARNTLLAVLTRDQAGLRIGGEYWDAIVWVTAAWHHYLATGDRAFLQTAFEASINSLAFFEKTEQDPNDGLFRGGACFQDGVAGYPDYFADGPTSGIADWVKNHPRERAPLGHGLPMKALSTNALYYNAYRLLPAMAAALGVAVDPSWTTRAEALKSAINRLFWNERTGHYRYLLDAPGPDDHQEGFGHAFVLLFGIASREQAASVLRNQHVTPHGIPCVWPAYERYTNPEGTTFGRHSGVIWSQVNTAWSMALTAAGQRERAWQEIQLLAAKACRDNQFAEIYHPVTGAIYGGLQEWYDGGPIREWASCQRQTWCATGYMGMLFSTLLGVRLSPQGLDIDPWLPPGLDRLTVTGLRYGRAEVSITLERGGAASACEINGVGADCPHIDTEAVGPRVIKVRLG